MKTEEHLWLNDLEAKLERLSWFGHMQRRDSGYTEERMLNKKMPRRNKRGRSHRSHIYTLKRICKLFIFIAEDAGMETNNSQWMFCKDHI